VEINDRLLFLFFSTTTPPQLGGYHKEAHMYPNVAGKGLFLFLSIDKAINIQFEVGESGPLLQTLS
jgi:hypothetical protein